MLDKEDNHVDNMSERLKVGGVPPCYAPATNKARTCDRFYTDIEVHVHGWPAAYFKHRPKILSSAKSKQSLAS